MGRVPPSLPTSMVGISCLLAILHVLRCAGCHSENKRHNYEAVCKKSCRVAMKMLMSGSSAVEAVMQAIVVLEDSPLTNAGIGSNLTESGSIECDASIMDGKSLNFGAVGALEGIQNPIKVAKELLIQQNSGLLLLGRIPPCCLAGSGAQLWAVKHGFTLVNSKKLQTAEAYESYRKYKRKLLKQEERIKFPRIEETQVNLAVDKDNINQTTSEMKLDTVGAICIDREGNVASAVSSGGISLKQPGRLGQAAMYGCGCWAQNSYLGDQPSVAVSVSGGGEFLIKTIFARECCNCLLSIDDAMTAVLEAFENKFLCSPFLKNVNEKLAGALLLKHLPGESNSELIWAHTTSTMCLGYMSSTDEKPHAFMSRQPVEAQTGKSVVVEGRRIKHSIPAINR